MSDDPNETESKVTMWGQDVSVRGMLAFVSIVGLTGLTFMHTEVFAKAYESIAIAIVAFYFGQASRK